MVTPPCITLSQGPGLSFLPCFSSFFSLPPLPVPLPLFPVLLPPLPVPLPPLPFPLPPLLVPLLPPTFCFSSFFVSFYFLNSIFQVGGEVVYSLPFFFSLQRSCYTFRFTFFWIPFFCRAFRLIVNFGLLCCPLNVGFCYPSVLSEQLPTCYLHGRKGCLCLPSTWIQPQWRK